MAGKTISRLWDRLPKLTAETRSVLAEIWPWVTLGIGFYLIFYAYGIILWANTNKELLENTEVFRELALYGTGIGEWSIWIVIGLILILGTVVFGVVSFLPLRKKRLYGWRLNMVAVLMSLAFTIGALLLRYFGDVYRGGVLDDYFFLIVELLLVCMLLNLKQEFNK